MVPCMDRGLGFRVLGLGFKRHLSHSLNSSNPRNSQDPTTRYPTSHLDPNKEGAPGSGGPKSS